MVAEESCLQLMEHYTSFIEGLSDITTFQVLNTLEIQYQKKIESLLNDENCYKIVMVNGASTYIVVSVSLCLSLSLSSPSLPPSLLFLSLSLSLSLCLCLSFSLSLCMFGINPFIVQTYSLNYMYIFICIFICI